MADMHDPYGQDSDSSSESASDTEINSVEEDNAKIDKNGKTFVKSKTFDFLTVDFGPENDDNNTPGTSGKAGRKKKKKANLQESFVKFKKEKQKEILRKRKLKELRKRHRLDPGHADRLRQKFVNQAKKYFGVPYARKYWPPESLEFKSPLFLDCCALVRQAVRDLEDDFGFRIGPWNQAYMFDTLPNKIEHERDMRPGDLVFMSGVYHKKKRQQKHHMTHVEIWAGDGNKTIGARWNNGKVQVFDNYRFEAKSFHSTEYHFRSIDTWLHGTCKSFCPQHRWKRSKYAPKKKSVFHVQVENQVVEQDEQDEGAGDSSDNETPEQSRPDTALSRDTPLPPKSSMTSINADSLLVVQKCEPQNGEKLFEIEKTYAIDKNLKDFKVSVQDNVKLEPKTSDKFLNLDALGSILEETSKSYPVMAKKGSEDSSFSSLYDMNGQISKSKSQRYDTNQEYDDCPSAEPTPDFDAYLDNDYLDEKDFKSSSSDSGMPRSKTEINFYSKQAVEDSICKDLIRPSSALSSSERTDTGKSADQDIKDDGSKQSKKSPATRVPKLPACSLPANMVPTFFVGGGNGVALVEAPLVALGWKRTTDKYDEKFRLKWVECKTRINYGGFKEGEQLVNHIPNCNLLTNKLGLLNSLQEYERVTLSTKGRPPRLRFSDFVPETYRLDEKNDREIFLNTYKDGETWICKPTGMNQGKGIFLLRSQEEITKLLEEREQKKEKMSKTRTRPLMTRLVQRYIENPLLLDGRKFDIRAYMLIASTVPFLVLYQKGYVRLSCNKYIPDDNNLTTHLTNQFIQKKDPNYKEVKEDTAWSMDKFNEYINENFADEKGIEQDWVYNTLTKQMQKIMIHLFNSVKHKLQARTGFFDLYGLDFMVDTDMKIWLIEVNINPALHINCEALKEVIPGVVEESIYLAIECFEKTRKNLPLMPLQSLNNFTVLYCGTRPFCVAPRQTRSVSPMKENAPPKFNSLSFSTAQPRRAMSPVRTMHRMTTQSTPVVSGANSNKVEASSNSEQSAGAVPKSASVAKSAVQRSQTLITDESVKLKMTHTDAATVATAGSIAQTSSTSSSNTMTTTSQSKPITNSITTLPNIAKTNTSSTSVSTATASMSMPTNIVTQSSITKTSPTVSTSMTTKPASTTKTSKFSDLGVSLSIPASNTATVLKPAVVTPNYDLETTLSFKRSRDRDRLERGN